jgi:hypothetical protein
LPRDGNSKSPNDKVTKPAVAPTINSRRERLDFNSMFCSFFGFPFSFFTILPPYLFKVKKLVDPDKPGLKKAGRLKIIWPILLGQSANHFLS